MFTGLVEISTIVRAVEQLDASQSGGNGFSITIGDAASILDDCHLGDSIAVDGTCLTVTEFSKTDESGWFKVGLAPETLRHTNLKDLRAGQKVNCERAMSGHARFGGHVVQGHVDTVGEIVGHSLTGNAVTLTIRLTNDPELPRPSELAPYLIPKGYISINGISLTLIDVSPPGGGALTAEQAQLSQDVYQANRAKFPLAPTKADTVEFTVMLIAHSQSIVDPSSLELGKLVNVEFDMAGKLVVRSVQGALATADSAPDDEQGTFTSLERLVERIVLKVNAEGDKDHTQKADELAVEPVQAVPKDLPPTPTFEAKATVPPVNAEAPPETKAPADPATPAPIPKEAPEAEKFQGQEPPPEEPTHQASIDEEPKAKEAKPEESKPEESKPEESKPEEPKAEEPKPEESKAEEQKVEKPKVKESKAEGSTTERVRTDVAKPEATTPEAPRPVEPNSGDRQEDPEAEVPKNDEVKVAEPQSENPKIEDAKAEMPRSPELALGDSKPNEDDAAAESTSSCRHN